MQLVRMWENEPRHTKSTCIVRYCFHSKVSFISIIVKSAMKCCFPSCSVDFHNQKNNYHDDNISHHKFPTHTDARDRWLNAIANADKTTYKKTEDLQCTFSHTSFAQFMSCLAHFVPFSLIWKVNIQQIYECA